MHEIHVSVVSPEEAASGVAELWVAGRMIAFTHIDQSDLMLRIDPRIDGEPVIVGVHALAGALAQAQVLLTGY